MSSVESFLPEIEEAYLELHTWLSSLPSPPAYRKNSIQDKTRKEEFLAKTDMLSAAAQYYVLFPGHFFKVAHTLKAVIGSDKFANWLSSSRICIVDVGCGAGAASAAFINCILGLRQDGILTQPIELCCFGIDVNPYAIGLYNQMMYQIKSRIGSQGVSLDYKLIPQSDSEARIQLKDMLDEKRKSWRQPFLSQVFIMQVNVVSPFSKRYTEIRKNYDELKCLGIDPSLYSDHHQAFGRQEALAYKQILEEVAIDRLHLITIGTDDEETNGYEIRVREMAEAISNTFNTGKHEVEKIGLGKHTVSHRLPRGSYWKEWKNTDTHSTSFHVDVTSITSAQLDDPEWAKVVDIDNLQLAWARARRHLLEQALADEVEIRLFESNLEGSLEKVQQQLIAYASEVIRSDDRLSYRYPKSPDKTRPLGLSRIEEEILSTALIQKLGSKVADLTRTSFAYKFPHNRGSRDTEYLYESWFTAYIRFIEKARSAVRELKTGLVIRLDIKSFYTRIIRDQLTEIAAGQLTRSERVEWLIRLLLSNDIDEHDAGLGIVQGNLSSGFFANLYLLDLDSRFPLNNEWEAQFFRYVDDMIIVFPDPDSTEEIIEVVKTELSKRGLELNDEKTELLSPQDFLNVTATDDEIDELQKQSDKLIPPLWILNTDNRKILKTHHRNSDEQWWDSISIYRCCLQALGLFFPDTVISRRISSYLFNQKKRSYILKDESELEMPSIPVEDSSESIEDWGNAYRSANQKWVEGFEQFRSQLTSLFHQSLDALTTEPLSNSQKRKFVRRVRYSANRLSEIGFGKDVISPLIDILSRNPALFRDITDVIESLARQQFSNAIKSLLSFYSRSQDEMAEYMKAITIRAVRFLDQIDSDLWDEIAQSAVASSLVECLLATETWLFVGDKCRQFISETQLDQVEKAFHNSTSSRLRKNYLLILAKFRELPTENLNVADDSLLSQAFESAAAGEVDSLFDYQEHEIIKRKYYSGVQDVGGDDGYVSPGS